MLSILINLSSLVSMFNGDNSRSIEPLIDPQPSQLSFEHATRINNKINSFRLSKTMRSPKLIKFLKSVRSDLKLIWIWNSAYFNKAHKVAERFQRKLIETSKIKHEITLWGDCFVEPFEINSRLTFRSLIPFTEIEMFSTCCDCSKELKWFEIISV